MSESVVSQVMERLRAGAPFIRIFLSDGRIYDASLGGGGVMFQEKVMRPVGEPFVAEGEQLLQLEKNWELDFGLDENNSWIPGDD